MRSGESRAPTGPTTLATVADAAKSVGGAIPDGVPFPEVEALSTEQLVALLVRPAARDLTGGAREGRLRARFGEGSGRIGKDEVTSPWQLRQVTRAAASGRFPPLLVSVNQEGGRLNAVDWPQVVQVPTGQALGAAGDVDLAERAGAAIGGQLRAAGLTWNLAPVCDLACWPSAAPVGTRAIGSDPQIVARLAAGFVRGLQGEGVAATAKHFPGLGGVSEDPHATMTVLDRLLPGALKPFASAIEAGVASVMVGSHVVRQFDEVPAVYSARVIDGVLRDRLGFEGVVVSENLSLPAVHAAAGGVAQAAVRAVSAGVDVVMLDSEISRGAHPGWRWEAGVLIRRQVVQALVAAVGEGRIRRARLEASAVRMLGLHARFGLTGEVGWRPWGEADLRAAVTAERIARRALTVLRGKERLPLCLDPSEVVVTVHVPACGDRRADSARHCPDLLPRLLGAHHPRVAARPPGTRPLPTGTGAVVVSSYDTLSGGRGRPGRAAAEASRLAAAGHLVVHVALGDVDELAGSTADVLVAGYSPHPASVRAVASALFGDLKPTGVLPLAGVPW